MTTELSKTTVAIQTKPENPIGQMLQAITSTGITPENAAALEKLTDLYLRVEGVNARKAFIEAKAALQSDLPPIQATKAVPNNDGSVRYKFAPYEEIMRAVGPSLVRHGFSISFSQEIGEGRIVAVCTLSHVGGHSESNSFAVRAGKGPPGSSEAQADGSASSYAKRFALCNCLNITIGLDDDARLQGDVITPGQAADLERRLNAVGGNVAGFLKLADAPSFGEIRANKYDILCRALAAKEQSRQKPQQQPKQPAPATKTRSALLSHAQLVEAVESVAATYNVPPSVTSKWLAAKVPAKSQAKLTPAARAELVEMFEAEAKQQG